MRILIVEDDFIQRKILMRLLEKYGACEVAVDGHEALDAFRMAHKEKDPYRVVFLDIQLPKMDGREVLTQMREHEQELGLIASDGCKIYMTTAVDDSKVIMKAFRAGCDGYFLKPYDVAKINETMSLLFIESTERG